MNDINEILIQCIDDIRAGRTSLEECLERYSDIRRELEPLLKIALSIEESPNIRPSDAFKVRARVGLMEHIASSQSGKRTAGSAPQASIGRRWFSGWVKAVTITVAAILFVSAAGTGTAFASQSSLPGNTLYPVKLATEQIWRVITFDDAAEVELELKFAGIRLDELERIVNMPESQASVTTDSYHRIMTVSVIYNIPGREKRADTMRADRIAAAITGYERNLNLAITKAEYIKDGQTLMVTIALAIRNHLDRLDEIEDGASDEAEGITGNARDIAINGHIKALRNVAEKNPVRAIEINADTMLSRLGRAEDELETDKVGEMEKSLQHFQVLHQLGKEISEDAGQMGYDTRAIDKINTQTTARQMQILVSIYDNTSGEIKDAVKKVMATSLEEYEQAVNRLQQQGALDEIPEGSLLPGDILDDIKGKIMPPESEKPVDSSGEPGDGSGESGDGAGEPGDGSGEPGDGSGEPGDGSGEPGDGSGEPGDGSGEPGDGSGEPGDGSGESGNGAGEPDDGSGGQGDGSGGSGGGKQ